MMHFANQDIVQAHHDFKNVLLPARLGKQHETLESFQQAAVSKDRTTTERKEYTLIVVTSDPRQILLGKKHRGFGHGMFNSFGGKVEAEERVGAGAARELFEETGIEVPHWKDGTSEQVAAYMNDRRVGTLRFTFSDSPKEMIVHLYRIQVAFSDEETTLSGRPETDDQILVLPSKEIIRGCEEITPMWLNDWHDVPLDNMFADDSIWLPLLLSGKYDTINGSFHFAAGGQDTNTITDYYVETKPNTLERRLFNALHRRDVNSPSIKEFKESYAFFNKVRAVYKKHKTFDVVIDVAGGHGALGVLFVVSGAAKECVVVDPAKVGSVRTAWGRYMPDNHLFRFRHECLRSALPDELRKVLRKTSADQVLVVACHACQHLSDEVCRISTEAKVHVAVMPCCQKDLSKGSHWKETARRLNLSIEVTMDLLLAGKYSKPGYDVRIKFIDKEITPQNRIIICRADSSFRHTASDETHQRLGLAYARAHPETHSSQQRKRPRLRLLYGTALALACGSMILMKWRRP